MVISVTQYLEEVKQIKLTGVSKQACPSCNHNTLSIKSNVLAKCFHPGCDYIITPNRLKSPEVSVLQELMWSFAGICNQFKLNCLENRNQLGGATVEYIQEERKIHEEVIRDVVTLGIVPYDIDWEGFLSPFRGRVTPGALQAFDDAANRLRACANAGSVSFLYLDCHSNATSIKFRQPRSKNITWFTQGKNEKKGAFTTLLTDPGLPPPSGCIAIVEGEFNILQLQSLQKRCQDGYVEAYALGGVDTVDESIVRSLKYPLVHFEDHDDGGRNLTLRLSAIRKIHVARFHLPDEDLDSFIRRQVEPKKATETLKKLIGEANVLYRCPKAIQEEILGILAAPPKTLATRLKPHEISKRLVHEFRERGKFLKTQWGAYYLSSETFKVVPVQESSLDINMLIHGFGLNPAEKEFDFVMNELSREAYYQGKPVEIYWTWHYDEKTNRLYWYNSDKQVFRISTEGITEHNNGEDGFLFIPPEGYQAFDRIEFEQEVDYFEKFLFEAVSIKADSLKKRHYYERLLRNWLLAMPFDELNPTRPLLTLYGEKGSGKTSWAKRIGQMLFGDCYTVSVLPSKVEDLDVLLTNQPYVVLDNLDNDKPWMNDRLAQAATGGTVERRELYTTNKLVRFPIRSLLVLTTRTPYFRRDDVADRLLVLQLERLSMNKPESLLIAQVQENRNAFMSWYLVQLQAVIQQLSTTTYAESNFRMADFGSFCLRLAMAEGKASLVEMKAILQWASTSQTQFAAEGDPLIKLLLLFAKAHGDQRFLASQILQELRDLAEQHRVILPEGLTANALGKRLSHGLPALSELVDIKIAPGANNKRFYTLSLK